MFPRGQEELLYPDPEQPWKSNINIFEPDYTTFPKFKDATPIHFTVGPGETLYIPFGTWHTAYSLTPTISVAFDQLSSINHKDFLKDVWSLNKNDSSIKAAARYGYAWLASKTCLMGERMKVKH